MILKKTEKVFRARRSHFLGGDAFFCVLGRKKHFPLCLHPTFFYCVKIVDRTSYFIAFSCDFLLKKANSIVFCIPTFFTVFIPHGATVVTKLGQVLKKCRVHEH